MKPLSENDLEDITRRTLGHYGGTAARFWEGTRDHDVSQNIGALLDALQGDGPRRILDLGCGPGRDLARFKALGHEPVGLDGSAEFVEMARAHSRCEVLHQNFLALDLAPESFDGVFANASLFHVPVQELARVLGELYAALVPGGVLFSSNPRGSGEEGWNGERYGAYHDLESWRAFTVAAGFEEAGHYYRPPGRPRAEQPWLASLWRRPGPR
jgi:SAM-dependent methyltransferase